MVCGTKNKTKKFVLNKKSYMLYVGIRKIQKLYRSLKTSTRENLHYRSKACCKKKKSQISSLVFIMHPFYPCCIPKLQRFYSCNCSHFTDWEIEAQTGTNLPKTTKCQRQELKNNSPYSESSVCWSTLSPKILQDLGLT